MRQAAAYGPAGPWLTQANIRKGQKIALRGGGGDGYPFSQPPPPPSLAAVTGRGGFRAGAPDLPCWGGGGGGNPTSMAQNDTHVALIMLTTQMGGGGGLLVEKIFRAKFCVPVPLAPTSVLTQNKGPNTEPHFSNPPPLLRQASMSPPPPPPATEQFSGCQEGGWRALGPKSLCIKNGPTRFSPLQILLPPARHLEESALEH